MNLKTYEFKKYVYDFETYVQSLYRKR